MRIESFTTKNGETVELDDFTVLVGPNNTGKSQTLSDIEAKMSDQDESTIINEISIKLPDQFEDLTTGVEYSTDSAGRDTIQGIGSDLSTNPYKRVSEDTLRDYFSNQRNTRLVENIGVFKVAHLDTSSRLEVASSGPAHNRYETAPSSLLQALYEEPSVDEHLRTAFQNVFSREDQPTDIKFDHGGQTTLYFRVAEEFDNIPENPRKAGEILKDYRTLDEEGDGYRSFVGVVLSLLLFQDRIILLDEPEAFLHPAQSRELGRWIANHSSDIDGQVVIATHDADFISGILNEGTDVDIYRLNRRGDRTVYNLMSSEITEELADDPLLSSQRVLEAIFHEGVIVCEGGSDKAVYRSIAVNELGNDQLLFVNAHGKHNIKEITSTLREADIPVAAITDIDIIRNHHPFLYLLESLADADFDGIMEARRDIESAIQDIAEEEVIEDMIPKVREFLEQLEDGEHSLSGAGAAIDRLKSGFSEWNEVKQRGIAAIPDENLEDDDHPELLMEEPKEYGLFIVPVGELEGWIDLDRARKSTWVVKALEVIVISNREEDGENEEEKYDYTELTSFVEEIEDYLTERYSELIRAQSY